MADLTGSAVKPNYSLKLFVKGFAGFDMRLIEGVIKLSQRRCPCLELVSDPGISPVDIVMIDAKDEGAVAWAARQQSWLARQPVLWVDNHASLLSGHTGIKRPVQWSSLPVLLSRAIDNASHGSHAGEDISFDLPAQPKPAAAVSPNTAASPAQISTNRLTEPAPSTPVPKTTKAFDNLTLHPLPKAQGGIPLLVVDDSFAVRAHLSSVLRGYGYHVTAVESGEAGVVAVTTNKFACVLMDVLMPGIDGYDACRRIKAMGHASAVPPVVMLTSKSSPFDKIRGKMAGCDAYLTKPVEKSRLMEVLAQIVGKNDTPHAKSASTSSGSGVSSYV